MTLRFASVCICLHTRGISECSLRSDSYESANIVVKVHKSLSGATALSDRVAILS